MLVKKRKSNKYIFSLKNVNTEKVDHKYGITLKSNITNNKERPDKTTKLSDLNEKFDKKQISFLDEGKKNYQCNISMIDLSSGKEVDKLEYYCYWCRHPFTSKPIGCPINYISSKIKKTYFSEISKENRTIKENITRCKHNILNNKSFKFTAIKKKTNYNFVINKEEYYVSDGVFCSFNCCKAFIDNNKHIRLYEQSNILLLKIYNELSGLKNTVINAAPNWRLLEEYGGDKTINQFREDFNKISYEYKGLITPEILFKPIGVLFEERINF